VTPDDVATLLALPTTGAGVALTVTVREGRGGAGVGTGVGTGVGIGVGTGVGAGVGTGVGTGVGAGVGAPRVVVAIAVGVATRVIDDDAECVPDVEMDADGVCVVDAVRGMDGVGVDDGLPDTLWLAVGADVTVAEAVVVAVGVPTRHIVISRIGGRPPWLPVVAETTYV